MIERLIKKHNESLQLGREIFGNEWDLNYLTQSNSEINRYQGLLEEILNDIRKLTIPSWDSLKVDQLGFIKIEGVENGR
jgi:hypothetical protein